MRFRLMEKDNQGNKIGKHLSGKVVHHRFSKVTLPGEIIESDEPLDRIFRGKFIRLSDATPEPVEAETPKGKGRRK